MSRKPNYYVIENGSYYFKDGENDNIILMTDTVAVVFDKNEGLLLKHGRPDATFKYYEKARSAVFISEDLFDFIFLEGNIPVDDLNKMITHSGYVKIWYDKQIAESNQSEAIHYPSAIRS